MSTCPALPALVPKPPAPTSRSLCPRPPAYTMGRLSRPPKRVTKMLTSAVQALTSLPMLLEAEESLRRLVVGNESRRRAQLEVDVLHAEEMLYHAIEIARGEEAARQAIRRAEEDGVRSLFNEAMRRASECGVLIEVPFGHHRPRVTAFDQLIADFSRTTRIIFATEQHERQLVESVCRKGCLGMLGDAEGIRRRQIEAQQRTAFSVFTGRVSIELSERGDRKAIALLAESSLESCDAMKRARRTLEEEEMTCRDGLEARLIRVLQQLQEEEVYRRTVRQYCDVPYRETIGRGCVMGWEAQERELLLLRFLQQQSKVVREQALARLEQNEAEERCTIIQGYLQNSMQLNATFQRQWAALSELLLGCEPERRALVKEERAARDWITRHEMGHRLHLENTIGELHNMHADQQHALDVFASDEKWARVGLTISEASSRSAVERWWGARVAELELQRNFTTVEAEERATRDSLLHDEMSESTRLLITCIRVPLLVHTECVGRHRLEVQARQGLKDLEAALHSGGRELHITRLLHETVRDEEVARSQIVDWYLVHLDSRKYAEAELTRRVVRMFVERNAAERADLHSSEAASRRELEGDAFGALTKMGCEAMWQLEHLGREGVLRGEQWHRAEVYKAILVAMEEWGRWSALAWEVDWRECELAVAVVESEALAGCRMIERIEQTCRMDLLKESDLLATLHSAKAWTGLPYESHFNELLRLPRPTAHLPTYEVLEEYLDRLGWQYDDEDGGVQSDDLPFPSEAPEGSAESSDTTPPGEEEAEEGSSGEGGLHEEVEEGPPDVEVGTQRDDESGGCAGPDMTEQDASASGTSVSPSPLTQPMSDATQAQCTHDRHALLEGDMSSLRTLLQVAWSTGEDCDALFTMATLLDVTQSESGVDAPEWDDLLLALHSR
eukprot:Sspe_Gene.70707::Locus_41774_Transcript_1_1_Confidence_1.000_Length_2860::g.70707::m.70707